jgi:hypothetical protein
LKQKAQLNELYFKRLSRFSDPSSYEIYISHTRNLILKSSETFKRINGTFDNRLISIDSGELDFLPENLNRRISKLKKHIAHHNPEFLYELLTLGHFTLCEVILHRIYLLILKQGYVPYDFEVELIEMQRLLNTEVVNLEAEYQKNETAVAALLA